MRTLYSSVATSPAMPVSTLTTNCSRKCLTTTLNCHGLHNSGSGNSYFQPQQQQRLSSALVGKQLNNRARFQMSCTCNYGFDYLIMSCLFLVGESISCLFPHQNESVLLLLSTRGLGWNKSI